MFYSHFLPRTSINWNNSPLEGWNTPPPVENNQEYIPILNLQTKVNLLSLKKSMETVAKNGTYLWKTKDWFSCKSVFLDGKRIGKKPDKHVDVYDTQGKKFQRAREREAISKAILDKNTKKTWSEEPIVSELSEFLKQKRSNSIIYYVPVEDGKGNIVKYEIMYISKDSSSEILRFPIKDLNWKVIRQQTIARGIPLERPDVDPIDLFCIGGGIFMSFAKGLATVAPKVGINLSKVAVNEMSHGAVFLQTLWKEIPKEIFQQVTQTGVNIIDEEVLEKN